MKGNRAKLLARIKAMQKQIKEIERAFYVEFGTFVEKELRTGNLSDDTIQKTYNELRKKYGI